MMNWQDWIEKNWQTIEYWARKWSWFEWGELISLFSIYLQKNWKKFSKIPDGEERIKFMQSWFKNNVNWTNSEFNRIISTSDDFEIIDELLEDATLEEPQVDVGLLFDLKREFGDEFSDEQLRRLVCIKCLYKTMPAHQQVLYDLYFTKMMSLRKISDVISIPMSSVWQMICELKKEIKEKC